MHFKVKASLVINIGMSLGKHKLCNRSRVGHWHAHGLTSCAFVDMHRQNRKSDSLGIFVEGLMR